MSEVRTVSSTGGAKGVKEERYDLIPKDALDQIARVYAFGAEKYADHNWRRRYEWGKSYAALQRHLHAFWDGQTYDEESGLPHLAHAGFHIFALLTWLARDGEGVENEFDDRWTTAFERREQETAAEEEERLLAEQAALDAALPRVITGDPSVEEWVNLMPKRVWMEAQIVDVGEVTDIFEQNRIATRLHRETHEGPAPVLIDFDDDERHVPGYRVIHSSDIPTEDLRIRD